MGRAACAFFDLFEKAVNMLTNGLTNLTGASGAYHPTDSFIIPDDGESFIFYHSAFMGIMDASYVLLLLSFARIQISRN